MQLAQNQRGCNGAVAVDKEEESDWNNNRQADRMEAP